MGSLHLKLPCSEALFRMKKACNSMFIESEGVERTWQAYSTCDSSRKIMPRYRLIALPKMVDAGVLKHLVDYMPKRLSNGGKVRTVTNFWNSPPPPIQVLQRNKSQLRNLTLKNEGESHVSSF